MICAVRDCGSAAKAKGWCGMHYARWKRNGDPEVVRSRPWGVPLEERFWNLTTKGEAPGECWIWHGAKDRRGYGLITVANRTVLGHRLAYQLFVGEVPEGLELDHLCRVPSCVNPEHLEAVTHAENVRRARDVIAATNPNRRKTHCPKGHPYSGPNLYRHPNGSRRCRACRAAA